MTRLIETDEFPFEFLSELGERESWRKEIHRPIYHVHKWWAKRLGSVFRGILLGGALPEKTDLRKEFYQNHSFSGITVLDPFLGSGTTIGEAHKLGFTALGRDINPVAVEAVRSSLGTAEIGSIQESFGELSRTVGGRLRSLYISRDLEGKDCEVLYYFWVMQAGCPGCLHSVDLFSSYVFARNALPNRKPEIQILCPSCGAVFPGVNTKSSATCPSCKKHFETDAGTTSGAKCVCQNCKRSFSIIGALGKRRPSFRLYAKLVLTQNGDKQYISATAEDHVAYNECSCLLQAEETAGSIILPRLSLSEGHNTRQAMSYNFATWRDFFNNRQLLALGWLQASIGKIQDLSTRRLFQTLFSGVLEFNNMFASYKGEGTGAVRHMFSHHILKPERIPIEANVWGTPKSSGAFSGLFRGRLLRAMEYRAAPTELYGKTGKGVVCSPPFSGRIEDTWPTDGKFAQRGLYVSCGDSSSTSLPPESIDLVITDPPFFDNVHYSELADFFYAWQQLHSSSPSVSSRNEAEVQDANADKFSDKLRSVFMECHRVLKPDGLLVFSYHHSREDGWTSLATAILGAGFHVVNSHPVKAEMSVATPKSQAKEPILLDIILVCRKSQTQPRSTIEALGAALTKLERLSTTGFTMSRNDAKIVAYGQLLTTLKSVKEIDLISAQVDAAMPVLEKYSGRVRHPEDLPSLDAEQIRIL